MDITDGESSHLNLTMPSVRSFYGIVACTSRSKVRQSFASWEDTSTVTGLETCPSPTKADSYYQYKAAIDKNYQ